MAALARRGSEAGREMKKRQIAHNNASPRPSPQTLPAQGRLRVMTFSQRPLFRHPALPPPPVLGASSRVWRTSPTGTTVFS